MRHPLPIVLSLAVIPAAAAAQLPQEVNAHIVYTGTGGTPVTREGIDFWPVGQSPRRYRTLGTIADRRGDGRFAGNAIGSGAVAKKIRQLGGDGVLVMSQAPDYGGEILTTMMIVQYVD